MALGKTAKKYARHYANGLWTEQMLWNAVGDGPAKITRQEFAEIACYPTSAADMLAFLGDDVLLEKARMACNVLSIEWSEHDDADGLLTLIAEAADVEAYA